MKRLFLFLMVLICAYGIAACNSERQEDKVKPETASLQDTDMHKIGVIVYSDKDEEVLAFKDYLKGYIEEVFPDVTFIYSGSITTEEEELRFIQDACDQGAEGFLSFLTRDLEKETALCAENKAYYMLASGTVSDETFASVEDNPYFIGEVGPGTELEYQTGADMAEHFYRQNYGSDYFILSGGGCLGNEMHLLRTMGILDKLQELYGVTFDRTSREIALSDTPNEITAGELKICVVPGYISREEYFIPAKEEYENHRYGIVLSVLPVAEMSEVVKDAHLGVIDCYSTRNLQLVNRGQLQYVAGKYSSIIGPSFAAMYNAVTGYSDDFRENGKAFQGRQGFWFSASHDDYVEKYAMANSVVQNAYNYDDLQRVCKAYNPDACLDDLKKLISAFTYEDALARRSQ
ncbi:MAG: hypothetical protein IJI25_00215 [Eubacterium sp.]|nr:hypothetical protein [Eubacterium sp.]